MNDDTPSRRATEPSMHAQRDPRATIQPGEPSSRRDALGLKTPKTLADLDAANATRITNMLATLRDDLGKRDVRMAADLDHKFAAFRVEVETKIAALGSGSPASVLPNPADTGDVLVSIRPRQPSVPDESEDDRIARLERDAAAENAENSARFGSLAQELAKLSGALREVQKIAAAQPTAIERVLTNQHALRTAVTIATLIATALGGTVYSAHKSDEAAQRNTQQLVQSTEQATERAVKEATKDSKPSVYIVKDDVPTPAPTKGK